MRRGPCMHDEMNVDHRNEEGKEARMRQKMEVSHR